MGGWGGLGGVRGVRKVALVAVSFTEKLPQDPHSGCKEEKGRFHAARLVDPLT